MPERDFYEVLGIPRDATTDQIKKAYRAMARKYHPDVNPGDKTAEGKFKEAQNAYDILSNEEKKSAYDRYGHAAFEGMAAAGAGPRASAADWTSRFGEPGYETIDFSEFFGPSAGGGGRAQGGGGIFDDLIGRVRGGRQAGPRPGQSVEADLTIPFLTAVRGGETSIDIERASGKHESLVVKIPAGVDTGAKLRLKGQGEPGGKGAPSGDLTVRIKVEPHPYFKREGADLSVEIPISVGEAILGAKVDVPTLDGTKGVPIPAGSSTGRRLRLKGQGVPATGGKLAGDLFAVIKVMVPGNVDEQSRKLIEEFQSRNPSNPREGLW